MYNIRLGFLSSSDYLCCAAGHLRPIFRVLLCMTTRKTVLIYIDTLARDVCLYKTQKISITMGCLRGMHWTEMVRRHASLYTRSRSFSL